jgi:dTDP-4-dehydrorhamnose reductase
MIVQGSSRESGKRFGVIIGGSGLIGGGIDYFFKKKMGYDILAPNSKKLSIRDPKDIESYFKSYRPDFIVNSAIASLDSDPKLSFEINYLGSINLAKVAAALGIPYIFISSAAVLPDGVNLSEEVHLPLSAGLGNYAKSKLMSELTLQHLKEAEGLDYTIVRLGIVYGRHDHKIQGFHRLLFSVADQSMPLLFTKKGICHSYTNARKIPYFVRHIIGNRQEFGGATYHFIDPEPVALDRLILTIRDILGLKRPRAIYLPLAVAQFGARCIQHLLKLLVKFGIDARLPRELMFLSQFYQTQILSSQKLQNSSFVDPFPEQTVYRQLPELIEYYLTRWEQLNLISPFYNKEFFDPQHLAEEFLHNPENLLTDIHQKRIEPFQEFTDIK